LLKEHSERAGSENQASGGRPADFPPKPSNDLRPAGSLIAFLETLSGDQLPGWPPSGRERSAGTASLRSSRAKRRVFPTRANTGQPVDWRLIKSANLRGRCTWGTRKRAPARAEIGRRILLSLERTGGFKVRIGHGAIGLPVGGFESRCRCIRGCRTRAPSNRRRAPRYEPACPGYRYQSRRPTRFAPSGPSTTLRKPGCSAAAPSRV
jgi:hypothetical protein